jgi:hypothetical protein
MRPGEARLIDQMSFVISSGQREKVLNALLPGPKTPAQVARETGLRLPHVSRALAQLTRTGLADRMVATPRGRLYAATEVAHDVFREIQETRGDRVIAPMVRGTHLRVYHRWAVGAHGKEAADSLFAEAGMDVDRLEPDAFYPVRAALHILELIERRYGDGSYELIRRMFREQTDEFPSVRRLLAHVVPMPILIELGPGAYNRDFNHGRLEVEVRDRRAIVKNYDWVSSPARCKAWWGTYEGILRLRGTEGTVSKIACILDGSPYCGYRIEW